MAVCEGFQKLFEVISTDILREGIALLKNFEKVDFAHLEDDGIDL